MNCYLKIENNEIVEAPFFKQINGKKIYGYNQQTNQEQLINDGYSKFEGNANEYTIKDGQITKKDPEIIEVEILPQQTIFTKLQIRRAMRELGIEHQLNYILNSNQQFKNDWNDAQEIDLNDPMIQSAILAGLISQETLDIIKNHLN